MSVRILCLEFDASVSTPRKAYDARRVIHFLLKQGGIPQ